MPDLPTPELMQEKLETWIARYYVAGATIGVMRGDTIRTAAAGVINKNTGVATTPDSLFQIGSITKLYTTTLVMQLVDAGRIDLDAPARSYLPGLRFADAVATETVTIRHLLTHTSGVEGDFFDDFGRGDDCLERYVAACSRLDSAFPPGAMWSYCNAGFVVLGRIVETMTGMTWDDALASRLLQPAGLEETVTLPERALRFRTAVGHSIDPALKISLTDDWSLPRAQGPAGATPCATVGDLLRFARLHLDEGRAASGQRLLSEESVRAMQVPQVRLPQQPGPSAAHFGLSWMLFDWGGHRVIGHDGGTIGQLSSLRILPEQRFAVAVLANTTPSGGLLLNRAVRWLFDEVLNISLPAQPRPPESAPQFDLSPYAGVYERLSQRISVELREGELFVMSTNTGPLPSPQVPPARLYPVDAALFLQDVPYMGLFAPVTFSGFEDGRPRYLFAGRVARRVE